MAIGGENFLSTRQNATSTVGFDVALEPQESSAAGSVTETIGFLAMEPSTGTWNSMTYEAQLTAALFTDDFLPLSFSNTYATQPSFVAGLATANGGDNAHLRYQNLTKVSVEVIVEEDTTSDTELVHGAESVAYLAIGGQGTPVSYTHLTLPTKA